jgi:ribosomal protein S18 acetylase RimI-like enzyme
LSPELTLRLANASDVDVIYGLLQQLADATGQRNKFQSRATDFLKLGFSDNPHFEVLLAEKNNTVIGLSLFFYDFSSWRGELGVYIQDLVVDSKARAQGIGRILVRETVRHAQQQGATHLRLSVEQDNHAAIRFYENLGLTESSSERIFAACDDDFLSLADNT